MPNLKKFAFDRAHHIVIQAMPHALASLFAEVTYTKTPSANCDLRVMFATDRDHLTQQLAIVAKDHLLVHTGLLYLLCPKAKDLNRDQKTGAVAHTGLQYLGNHPFGADYTLFAYQWRDPSPRLAQYDAQVPTLKARLAHGAPALARKFAQLTPTQQRDWARYIFSAKRPVTQNSHFDQMQLILAAGFATLEQYRQGQH